MLDSSFRAICDQPSRLIGFAAKFIGSPITKLILTGRGKVSVWRQASNAATQAHIPAIEIAFGDTFRETSHVVADCAHFRFRVAIGRRSTTFAAEFVHRRRNPQQDSWAMTTEQLGKSVAQFIATQVRSSLAHHAFIRDDAERCL